MTTQTQTQNQNQNQNEQQQQTQQMFLTRDEFDSVLATLVSDFKSQLKSLKDRNEKLQGEVDALKEFAAEAKRKEEISNIRAEARNQVLRELGYEVSGSESISTSTNNNHNSSSGKSSSFDYLFDWKNPNRRGLFG